MTKPRKHPAAPASKRTLAKAGGDIVKLDAAESKIVRDALEGRSNVGRRRRHTPAPASFRERIVESIRNIADENKAKLFVELVGRWSMYSMDRRCQACRHYESRIAGLLAKDEGGR
jgi:hypothetical protein